MKRDFPQFGGHGFVEAVDGKNLLKFFAWMGIGVVMHSLYLQDHFIDSTLKKVLRKDSNKTFAV